jgi:hypothetical protein
LNSRFTFAGLILKGNELPEECVVVLPDVFYMPDDWVAKFDLPFVQNPRTANFFFLIGFEFLDEAVVVLDARGSRSMEANVLLTGGAGDQRAVGVVARVKFIV